MSCLSLDELSLTEQAAVMASVDRAIEQRYGGLLDLLALRDATTPVTPTAGSFPARSATSLPAAPVSAGRPTRVATGAAGDLENAMAMQWQVSDHPPLQVCHPGHQPRMYETRGDGRVVFHVECPPCGVQTVRFASPEAAATAWAQRDVHAIPGPKQEVA